MTQGPQANLKAPRDRGRSVFATTTEGRIFRRAGGMRTTSDFLLILTSAANKVVEQRFKVAQSELQAAALEEKASSCRGQLRLQDAELPTVASDREEA